MRPAFCLLFVIAQLLLAPTASAQEEGGVFDRVLIQLNWGDDNVLIGAGETRESSPDAHFGRCSRTQIDGLVGQECSEGSSRLGLLKQVDLGDGLQATGALVWGMGVDADPESSQSGTVSLVDLGSYVRLSRSLSGNASYTVFGELYPVDARPLHLGFHPDIVWGTKDEFPRNFRRGQAPGIKLGYKTGRFYAFAGAKSTLIKSPLEVELESDIGNRILFSTRTYYGFLGGLGFGGGEEGVSLEVNGGVFHKGTLTKEGVLGKDIWSSGVSGRLAYRIGLPVGLRIDSGLYQRTQTGTTEMTRAGYDTGTAWSATLEGSWRIQNLSDFEAPGSTALEDAWASLAGIQIRAGDTRLHLEGRARSLTYITAEVPGFFPYSTLPSNAETSPELQGLASLDRRFGTKILALTAGVRLPATYRGLAPDGTGEDAATAGLRTVVIEDADAGGWYILPAGDEAVPVWWVEAGLKWEPADAFSVIAEILLGLDNNRTQVERNEVGHAERVYTEPWVMAFNVLGQFRF